jgi:hypothetical protein
MATDFKCLQGGGQRAEEREKWGIAPQKNENENRSFWA